MERLRSDQTKKGGKRKKETQKVGGKGRSKVKDKRK